MKRLDSRVVVLVGLGLVACGEGTGGSAVYPAAVCASAKLQATGAYCQNVLGVWAQWEGSQNEVERDGVIQEAASELQSTWSTAEAAAADEGADCSEHALTATEATTMVDEDVSALVESINEGLVLGQQQDAQCGADLLNAAGRACSDFLAGESQHIRALKGDPDATALAASKETVREAFSSEWTRAGCSTNATEEGTRTRIEALTNGVVTDTIAAANLDDSEFTMMSPAGPIPYLGKDLFPVCLDGSPFHFFGKRGTTNKLVMYYQGGGACWESLTCGIPTCDSTVAPDTQRDNPNLRESGFLDLENENNPFRDWHMVFVNHCGCDVHFGDTDQNYDGLEVQHHGFHNARFAEKWARERFLNPEVVFVAGSSAGAYGAVFHAPLLHEVWPASQFHVLADAGNGVITPEFLQNEFPNWNFEPNLPNIPGVAESITTGDGMPAYTEAVAIHFADTNWAHYSAAYDGSIGGQSAFYNVMLNDNDPFAAGSWWEASCVYNERMRDQAIETAEAVPSNYRYYIGTGSQHTMWGDDKVYSDTTGGIPTVASWIEAMLDSRPDALDPEWANVECANCGLTLADDPVPTPLREPFVEQGENVVIVCE